MNELLPRTEPAASVVASAKERSVANLRGPSVAANEPQADASAQQDTQVTERSSAAANYAKLKADIADVVAKLEPPSRSNGLQNAAGANEAIMSLMPQPIIVLPLPPADQDMVDFVAQVAQSVAQQSAMARAAQAHASSGVVDAAIQ